MQLCLIALRYKGTPQGGVISPILANWKIKNVTDTFIKKKDAIKYSIASI